MLGGPVEFGDYVLLRRLGRGGMADVYEAEVRAGDRATKRVALKILLPELQDQEPLVRSFILEATIGAKLHHPNIVQVFDFGQVEGTYYMSMELVEGRDLRRLQALLPSGGRLPSLAAAVYVVRELVAALGYIHGQTPTIVHRDVTPHNVFVTRDGHVKLGDFGIAKSALGQTLTRTGQIKGKLTYLAPEQAAGDPVSPRTDLYAAGLILFELATGERLLRGESEVELIKRAQRPRQVPPSTLVPAAAPLDPIVARALQPHPTLRYPSAEVLAEHLDQQLARDPFDAAAMAALITELETSGGPPAVDDDGEPVTTPYVGAGEGRGGAPFSVDGTRPAGAEPPRARRRWAVFVAAAALFGLAGFGGAYWLGSAPSSHVAPAPDATPAAATLAAAATRSDAAPTRPAPASPPSLDSGSPPARDATSIDEEDGPGSTAVRAVPKRRRRQRRSTRGPALTHRVRSPDAGRPRPTTPGPPPASAAQKGRLQRAAARARARGLWPGDTTEYSALTRAARSALRSGSGAPAALDALERHVDGFQIDRAFTRRKLARLEAAIRRAGLTPAQRDRTSADAQRVLRLILSNQLVQASELISAQMRRLARKR